MRIFALFLTLLLSTSAWANGSVRVDLATSAGSMTLQLYPDKAPKTVDNFLHYVNTGFYDGTVFHRVIKGFMIQGGGLTEQGQRKETTRNPIINEAGNGLVNQRGTIAMARTNDPHSATSQFFINHADNPFLDKSTGNYGYVVFGEVIAGLDVVDAIATVSTTRKHRRRDWPVDDIFILKASVVQ